MQLSDDKLQKEINDLKMGMTIMGLVPDKSIIEKFKCYIEILYAHRESVHLLSHQDYSRISKRHFLVSLLGLPYITGHRKCCDIGAGAGFPSIPLAIMHPEIAFTLFEAQQKKGRFLKLLIDGLKLDNVSIIADRAEYYKAEKFDLILIKAAGKIRQLIGLIDHLILPNGIALFYKAQHIEDEVKAAQAEITKRKFVLQIKGATAPIENVPLAFIILTKLGIG